MQNADTPMPEGTDAIIDDTAAGGTVTPTSAGATDGADSAGTAATAGSTFDQLKQAALDNTADLRQQAGEKAWSFADQGKARAGTALENLAKLVNEAADQVDEKVGAEFGGYARKAAEAVSGAAESLQNKSVDELVDDAKSLVRSSPAMAIGIAAALGFVAARLARSGIGGADEGDAA